MAAYLGSNTRVALLVEGHCDERGTEEYNRSLGSKRASNVREALIAAGADGNRITTATFGEDKRVATGQAEAVVLMVEKKNAPTGWRMRSVIDRG